MKKINKKEKVFNSCLIINNKGIVNYYDKRNLPNYGVFDEKDTSQKVIKN